MKKSDVSMGVQGCSIQQDGGGEGDVNNFASSQIRKGGAGNWKDYFTVRQNEVRRSEERSDELLIR